jgi:DDE family transposase
LNKRKVWVEPLFAEAKDWHGMRRFRLRRLWRVNCEALVIAAGHNLQQLLKKRGWGRRPFPTDALCASFWLFWVMCSLPFEREISSFANWFSFFKDNEASLPFY